MPLKLNVGLSRKVGDGNYGSRGASINVEVEVESALLDDPAKFKGRIRQVFGLARDSLHEELNGHGKPSQPAPTENASRNGAANGHTGNGHKVRAATQSQVKAIHAIAKSKGLNLEAVLHNHCRVRRPEDLTLKQASELIDSLKQERTAT